MNNTFQLTGILLKTHTIIQEITKTNIHIQSNDNTNLNTIPRQTHKKWSNVKHDNGIKQIHSITQITY